jgi:hypothetical protein
VQVLAKFRNSSRPIISKHTPLGAVLFGENMLWRNVALSSQRL